MTRPLLPDAVPPIGVSATAWGTDDIARCWFVLSPQAIVQLRDWLVDLHKDGPDPIPRGTFIPGKIEAAVNRAMRGPFPPDVIEDAFVRTALLLRGICSEHAFANGNKRTGLMIAFTNLDVNGFRLQASDDEAVAFMLRVASSEVELLEMADWLRAHSRPFEHSIRAMAFARGPPASTTLKPENG